MPFIGAKDLHLSLGRAQINYRSFVAMKSVATQDDVAVYIPLSLATAGHILDTCTLLLKP